MIKIRAILHASVIVADIDRALQFYCGVLGLEQDLTRPDLGYPGAWLRIGEQQIHLMQLPDPDAVSERPAHGGRDRHIALQLDNIEELIELLDRHRIPYTRSKSGRAAVFLRDPDRNALEFVGGR
jgi:glyoxylase I family protein